MPRFVILHHDCPDDRPRPTHWDLLLEADGQLLAWALEEPPDRSEEIVADRLPDHRLEYLDYEGPVSGGRGNVSRWDHGVYTVVEQRTDLLAVDLVGEKLHGRVTLVRDPLLGKPAVPPNAKPAVPPSRRWRLLRGTG
ncbi:MAG: DNA polymerase ligase N-terminal domain-containing protein [Pirellulales bacterium]